MKKYNTFILSPKEVVSYQFPKINLIKAIELYLFEH